MAKKIFTDAYTGGQITLFFSEQVKYLREVKVEKPAPDPAPATRIKEAPLEWTEIGIGGGHILMVKETINECLLILEK